MHLYPVLKSGRPAWLLLWPAVLSSFCKRAYPRPLSWDASVSSIILSLGSNVLTSSSEVRISFSFRNSVSCMSSHRKAFLVDSYFLISHLRWLKARRKKAKWLARPKKDRRLLFLGDGKEAMAIVFWGSGLMPWSEMRNPAKGISVPMVIFFFEIVTLMLVQRSRICIICFSGMSSDGAQLKMSSTIFFANAQPSMTKSE